METSTLGLGRRYQFSSMVIYIISNPLYLYNMSVVLHCLINFLYSVCYIQMTENKYIPLAYHRMEILALIAWHLLHCLYL